MIEVKLSFATQADLIAFFTGARSAQTVSSDASAVPVELLAGAMALNDIPAEVQEAAAPAKKPRAKKTEAVKAEEAPAAVEPAQESTAEQAGEDVGLPANDAAVSAPSYTVDDVRRALQDYVGRTDFATGTALVKSFGATRTTELKAEDYAAFIAKTQEQVAA